MADRTARVGGRAAVAVFTVSLCTMVMGAPRDAGAGPFTFRVSAESASDSSAQKSATARCPSGWVLVGAGANISNGGPRVVIDEVRPNGSSNTAPTAVTAWALEDGTGTASDWSIVAYATCTVRAMNVVQTSTTSAVSSNAERGAVATCPQGARSLLGTGFNINDGNGQVNVHDLIPDLGGDGTVTVRAHEDVSGYGGNWSVTAYAICGVVEGELIVRHTPGPQNSTNKGVTLNCHDGFQLFGMGVDMLSTVEGAGAGFGFTNDRLVMDEITPSGSLFTAPREVTIWVLEESPSPEIWWQDVYGICFDPA